MRFVLGLAAGIASTCFFAAKTPDTFNKLIGMPEVLNASATAESKKAAPENKEAIIDKLSVRYEYEAECFLSGAARYSIPVNLLLAVADEESGFNNSKTTRLNDNTSSYGVMQVNSKWFPEIEAKFNLDQKKIMTDFCTNVYVSAWILANYFKDKGRVWDNVGAYKVGFSPKDVQQRIHYVNRVKNNSEFYKRYLAIYEPDSALLASKGRANATTEK